jgi:hypothetical protein
MRAASYRQIVVEVALIAAEFGDALLKCREMSESRQGRREI